MKNWDDLILVWLVILVSLTLLSIPAIVGLGAAGILE